MNIGRQSVDLRSLFVDAEGDAMVFALPPVDPPVSYVSIDSGSGRLTVSSQSTDHGNHTIVVTCTDTYGAVGNATVVVVVGNRPPTLAQGLVAPAIVTEGGSVTYTFPRDLFEDLDGDDITYTVTIPTWLSYSPSLRAITGVVSAAVAGSHQLSITASDNYGGVGVVSTTLVVNRNPVLGPNGAAAAAAGVTTLGVRVPFQTPLPIALFVDLDGDSVTYALTDNSQAPWLSLNVTTGVAMLYGTPTSNSHTTLFVTVTASDGRGGLASTLVAVTIPNTAPVAHGTLATVLLSAHVNDVQLEVVAIPASAFDDVDGDTLTFVTAAAPGSPAIATFVSVSERSLIIAPRAGAQGAYTAVLTALDGHGGSCTSTYGIVVPNRWPTMAYPIPSPPAPAFSGTPWTLVIASDNFGDGDGDALRFTPTVAPAGSSRTSGVQVALPSWLSFDGQRRLWSGSPSGGDRGTTTVAVNVSDSYGGFVVGTVDITVANSPPVYVGRVYDQQVPLWQARPMAPPHS